MRAWVCACVYVRSYEMPMWLIIDKLLFYLLATSVYTDEEGEMDLFFQNCANTHRFDIFFAHFWYITYDIFHQINYDT